jgi:hypothetical protein
MRITIPIKQNIFDDGLIRYFVSIRLGSVTMDAMLDTGSTGLRVLSGALGKEDFETDGQPVRGHFSSGICLNGQRARGGLGIGSKVKDTVEFQCVQALSLAPWAKVDKAVQDMSRFRFGTRKRGGGFAALFGINAQDRDGTPNPLVACGIRRWVVTLPLPDRPEPGQLILNPTDADLGGFTTFSETFSTRGTTLPGALTNRLTNERHDGVVRLDSGAPGVFVASATPHPAWPSRTKAAIVLNKEPGQEIVLPFTVQSRGANTLRSEQDGRLNTTRITSSLPLLFLSMACDAAAGTLGLKRRRT